MLGVSPSFFFIPFLFWKGIKGMVGTQVKYQDYKENDFSCEAPWKFSLHTFFEDKGLVFSFMLAFNETVYI